MNAKSAVTKIPKNKETSAGRWLSYRPEIKVVDCTIRDGGLMNNHKFGDEIVKAVYQACVAAGLDYMELGYKASRNIIVPGGNCPMELLIGFLHNPKYNLLPILRCVQDSIEPLRTQLGWGFDLPYMMTGFLNEHPRAAIKFKESKTKGNIVDFYNQIWD